MTDRIRPFGTATIMPGLLGGIVVTVTPDILRAGRGKRLIAPIREDNDYWRGIDEQTQALLFALMVEDVEVIRTYWKYARVTWNNSTVTYSMMVERIAFSLRVHEVAERGKVNILPGQPPSWRFLRHEASVQSAEYWTDVPREDGGVGPFPWHGLPEVNPSWTIRVPNGPHVDRVRLQSIGYRDQIPPTAADRELYRRWLEDQDSVLAETPAKPFYTVSHDEHGMWLKRVDPADMTEDGGPYVMHVPGVDAASAGKAARIMDAMYLDPNLADRILEMMETD